MKITPKQKRTAQFLHTESGGAVWWRVGEGKTRIAIKYFALVAKSESAPRMLVICRRESFNDWMEEVQKCGLDHWVVRPVESPDDIFTVPARQPVLYLLSHGKLGRLIDELLEISGVILGVVFDEGWLYKNPRTEHCKAANKLSEAVGSAAILSGSMMTARDLTDVYGQLYAINKHHCLARTLTEFNSRFMYRLKIGPIEKAKFIGMRAARGAGKRVAERIKRCSSVYFPDRNHRQYIRAVRRIPASRDQDRAFRELRELWQLTLGDNPPMLLKMAPSIMTKCQQISDGWVKLPDPTDPKNPKKGRIVAIPSAKLDYLVSQVSELLTAGEKIVVWTAFRHSAEVVLQRLQKEFPKVGIYKMTGGSKFNLKGWKKDGRVAVCTEACGSAVNYFAQCAYSIYYSHDPSWRNMQQSVGRTDRKSSTHRTCYYYFLQTSGSMDDRIYSLVHSSRDEEKYLIANATLSWLKNN